MFCLRNFNEHVSLVCKKVNNQLNVVIRFRNLICTATKLKLYNAFILPHFQYYFMVWHFCSSRNREKLESLNKRALRIVFNRRIQNTLITIYKSLNYMKVFLNILNILSIVLISLEMLTLHQSVYSSKRTKL